MPQDFFLGSVWTSRHNTLNGDHVHGGTTFQNKFTKR